MIQAPFIRKPAFSVALLLRLFSLFALIFFTVTASQTATAQSESGSAAIEGAVFDQTGAGVAGASISVRNVETGLTRTATTGTAATLMFLSCPSASIPCT